MSRDESPTGQPGQPDEADPLGATHDRAREGLEHLQAAARELIQAARAALDVVEDLVDDPETVASLAGVADTFTGLVRSVVPGRRPAASDGSPGDDDGESPVQRIQVT